MRRQRLFDEDGSGADGAARPNIHVGVPNQPSTRQVPEGERFFGAEEKAGPGLAAITRPGQFGDHTGWVVVAVENEIKRQIGAAKLGQHRITHRAEITHCRSALGRGRLIRHDDQSRANGPEPPNCLDGIGGHDNVTCCIWRLPVARARVTYEFVKNAIPVEEDHGRPWCSRQCRSATRVADRLPCSCPHRQRRVRHQQVPDDRLKGLGVGRQPLRGSTPDDDAVIGLNGGYTVVSPNHPNNERATLLGQLDGIHEAHAHVVLSRAAPDGEDEEGVSRRQPGALEPLAVGDIPPLIVDPCSQLGHVVAWCVALEIANLPEVVDGMARVPGTASRSENEEATFTVADAGESSSDVIDPVCIKLRGDFLHLAEVLTSECQSVLLMK